MKNNSEELTNNKIAKIKVLLATQNIAIPSYQRPYRWSTKNVADLFLDIKTQTNKKSYRLGSIVFHHDKGELDIVDGQQRILTLFLIVKAILDVRLRKIKRQDIKTILQNLNTPINSFFTRQKFASIESQTNLQKNYVEIKRRVERSDFTEEHIDFLLNKCEVVIFILKEISEAFQFFDSQNSRGRNLNPHDLLKAYHLREFPKHENHLKKEIIKPWENADDEELVNLFNTYLYRIRQWSKGKSARYFNNKQLHIFKGVNFNKVEQLPYMQTLLIAHHYVDNYNQEYHRKIDGHHLVFPFSLDQQIINGRRFFEMIEYYRSMVTGLETDKQQLSEAAKKILDILNTYDERNRTGDKYIRDLFDCAVIFYIDKFGVSKLSEAIEYIFIWAYSCRLKQYAVQLATMDNYAIEKNIFTVIKEAVIPEDILLWPLHSIHAKDLKVTGCDQIVSLFKTMKYYAY